MGTSNAPYIMTLVNSIIGVSILAMPFCYKQCGILLASVILIFINLMTRLSCHYLLKSAIMTRRRTYEFLAFHAFGSSGKTVVELSIILLMIGTCIAFFVVMGDLGPAIIGSLLEIEYFAALRPAVLIGLAVFVILPLGLLRNVDSLSSICTASFLFYLFLVFKVFIESTDNLFSGLWVDEVHYWRPAGVLQCLPIFSMALSCQTQLLEIFDSVTNGTLDRMNSIVKSAVNLCTALYIAVGFFGYIAYYKTAFSGNLLMSFSESYFSEFIKLGFVLSVAVTFPMVVFPCRASLHSLLYKKAHTPHYELVTGGGNHIPETQFNCITLFIITSSLIVGLLAPNIEVVLGLLGSTIGVIICVLCPPCLFIWISNKATTEKVLAQAMCALGFFIMIMGTYANLYLSDPGTNEVQPWKNLDVDPIKSQPLDVPLKPLELKNVDNVNEKSSLNERRELDPVDVKLKPDMPVPVAADTNDKMVPPEQKKEEDKRVEPPVPIDPEAVKSPAKDEVRTNEKDIAKVAIEKDVAKVAIEKDVAKIAADANVEPKVKDEPKEKPVPAFSESAPKSREKQKLLSEQKEVLKRMREKGGAGASKIDKKLDDVSKSVQKKQPEKVVEKTNAKNIENVKLNANPPVEPKQEQEAPLNDVQKLAPLPILMKAATSKAKPVDGGGVQRDILQNAANAAEREKRDLDHMVNASQSAGLVVEPEKKVGARPDAELLKETALVENNAKSGGFVKNVAVEAANVEQVCEKEKSNQLEVEKKRTEEKLVEPILEKKVDAPTIVEKVEEAVSKEEIEKSVNEVRELRNSLGAAAKVDLTPHENTNEKKSGESLILAPSKLSSPELVLPDIVQSKNKNTAGKEESVILSSSKLSDPSLLLRDQLYIEEKKPMLRELKAIDKVVEAGNRKK